MKISLIDHLMSGASHICFAEGDPAPQAGGDTNKPWYDGHGDELVGHYQNKGWDKLTPAEAAKAAASAHREAERFVGVPADQIVRLPKDASDAEGLNTLQLRLGRPQAKENYDLAAVKYADGSAPDNGFADTVKELAFRSGLSNDRAVELAQGLLKYQEGAKATETVERTARLETDRAELKKNWGANYDAQLLVAKNVAAKLGVTAEAVTALEGQIGYKAVMEMFANVGSKIGEDKFVNALNPANPGIMTREAAVARKAELMNDTAWTKRYLDGDTTANRELQGLLTIIVGDDTEASRAA